MTLTEQIQLLEQNWQELVPGSVQLDKELLQLKHTQVTQVSDNWIHQTCNSGDLR